MEKGHWYTDKNGNHYFVKEGQSPQEGWEASKRRKMIKGGKYQVSEDGNEWKDVDKDEYDKYESDSVEFDENVDDDFGFDEGEKEHQEILNKIDNMNLTDKQKQYFYKELELVENNTSETYDNIVQLLDDAENEEIDNEDEVESYGQEEINSAVGKYSNKEETKEKKWNIGSDKSRLTPQEEDKLNQLRDALRKEGMDVNIKHGYEDYGANMMWKNLTSDGTWVLNPKEWLNYMNGDITIDDVIKEKKEGKYKDLWKFNKQSNNDYELSPNDEDLIINKLQDLDAKELNNPKGLRNILQETKVNQLNDEQLRDLIAIAKYLKRKNK